MSAEQAYGAETPRWGVWLTKENRWLLAPDGSDWTASEAQSWETAKLAGPDYEARPYPYSPAGGKCDNPGCSMCVESHANRAIFTGYIPVRQAAVELRERSSQTLADECQRLRDENTQLLAENARLRRELERTRRTS